MRCISDHEEYGYGGQNTSAGYLGMIYSPAAYADSVVTEYSDDVRRIVATYGNSWLAIPLDAQLVVAYGLYLVGHNYSPWSTAAGCGLT